MIKEIEPHHYYLIAIDPGAHPGYACFFRTLQGWMLTMARDDSMMAPGPEGIVVVEHPMIYPKRGRRRGDTKDPNAIVKLAFTAGKQAQWAAQRGAPIVTVRPYEWKGQVDKEVTAHRVQKRLQSSPFNLGELSVWDRVQELPETRRNGVIDAIGIGLYAVGRFGQGGSQ